MTNAPLPDLTLHDEHTAPGAAGDLLADARRTLGFVPNMYGNMANLPAVLKGYLDNYKAFRQTAGFTPVEQETIFLSISRVNGCNYCMAAHSMIAERMSKVPADVLAALRGGDTLPDPKLDALARFTREMVEHRGRPSAEAVRAFLDAGYTSQQALGVVLAIATKTFSNYVNHLAATEVDPAFAAYKIA
ncbi:MAG: carboxymuconolactone decarboxylase family protein [Rhodobacteraceae bacterium]|nr:carboxymuconolactone decarboxylase family protein [Paracoccaceae bacterium]